MIPAQNLHIGASQTGASSPRLLYRSEIFIMVRKRIPSCKRGTKVRSGMKSLSRESGMDSACVVLTPNPRWRHNHVGRHEVSLHVTKQGMKIHCHVGIKFASVRVFSCKHPLILQYFRIRFRLSTCRPCIR